MDELNLQCIDVDGLGEAPGLPVLEFRDPVMVSEFASDIDPGPGSSSGRAGRVGSWPVCIGFLVPELAVCILEICAG